MIAAHQRPVARVGEALTLAAAGASAMMDISDGLAKDLSRMCTESGVGARMDITAIPVSSWLEPLAASLGVDPLELALSGGEDYELLAAMEGSRVPQAREGLASRFGTALSEVGEVVEDGFVAVWPDGQERPLEAKGWDHFA